MPKSSDIINFIKTNAINMYSENNSVTSMLFNIAVLSAFGTAELSFAI